LSVLIITLTTESNNAAKAHRITANMNPYLVTLGAFSEKYTMNKTPMKETIMFTISKPFSVSLRHM